MLPFVSPHIDMIPSRKSWERRSGGAEEMEEGRDPAIKLFGTTIPVVASDSAVAEGPPEEGEVKKVVADSASSPAQGQKVSGESIQTVSFFSIRLFFI